MKGSHFFVTVAMLGAIVLAYFLGRSATPPTETAVPTIVQGDSSMIDKPRTAVPHTLVRRAPPIAKGAPLPALGTPLKDAFAELQARADAGDAVAATRLVHDISRCRRLRGSEWKNARATDDLISKKTDGMSPAQLRTYQALMDAMELRQQAVKKNQALCDGVSDEVLDSLTPNIQRAAQLGDEDARACYLARGPMYDARSLLDHPESLASYRNSAQSMIDAGLAAGDWKVVDLLQNAYEPGAQSILAGLVGADPYQHYRYLKLYRLGAEQFRVPKLEEQLASAAAGLTPAQVADADEWAVRTLQENFSGNSTNATPQGWDPCALPDS